MDEIFISYSRKDKDFVIRLNAALEARKRKAWVDLTDIPPTAKWREKIEGGIEAARAFVFVLSPDSMASTECLKEIDVATSVHKRLVPLVCREMEACSVHKDLSCLNYIFCREGDDFEAAIESLLKAVDTDLEWVDAHTKLLQKATEWDRKGRDKSLLLRGKELQEVVIWQAQSGVKEPKPTELMGRFILASSSAATQSKNNLIKGAFAVALVLAVIAGYAFWQRNKAIKQQNIAQSRELASTASNQLKVDPELAIVLSSKALDLYHTRQAEESLRHSLVKLLDSHMRVIMRGPHEGSVRSAAFSPDDNLIVTACEDGKARVWDAKRGEFKFEIAVNKDPLGHDQRGTPDPGVTKINYSADFSPDGKFIVTANANLQARVWEAESGKLLFELAGEGGHKGRVFGAAFCRHKDIKRIVTAGEDKTARVWDAENGKLLFVLGGEKGHKKALRCASFCPTGRRIVTVSEDKTARIWDAETGKFLFGLAEHGEKLYSATYSPDGRLIVTAGADRVVRVWDAETGAFFFKLAGEKGHTGWVRNVAFDPEGNRIITASQDQTARVWDAKTGQCLAVLAGHKGEVHSAAFSKDGNRIVTAGGDQTARVWELTKLSKGVIELSGDYGHQESVRSAAFSPDGRLVVTAGQDNSARVWDAETGRFLIVLSGHKGWVTSAAFSKDKRIVTASGDKTARVWDAETGKFLFELAGDKGHKGWVYAAAFSHDNKRIVTAGQDKTARVWDAETGKFLFELAGAKAHKSRVTSTAFSSDNKRIVTAGQDKTARVWDAETGKFLFELAGDKGHKGWVYSAAFSNEGKYIVTAGQDKTARVWDAETGRFLSALEGHKGWLTSAAFSNDSKRIVTAGEDRTARIWDVETGKTLVELPEHKGWVYSAAFRPDGNSIVTASEDQTARVLGYEMCCSFKELLDLARPLAVRQLTPEEREKFLHEPIVNETVDNQIIYTREEVSMHDMEWNIDRQGEDYYSFDLPITDPTLCQDACRGDPNCSSWTYVKPNTVKSSRPKCFLKKKVPEAKSNPACVTGVKTTSADISP